MGDMEVIQALEEQRALMGVLRKQLIVIILTKAQSGNDGLL